MLLRRRSQSVLHLFPLDQGHHHWKTDHEVLLQHAIVCLECGNTLVQR